MTLPLSFCPVTAAVAVAGGTVMPTGGFGEPCRWPGELVGPDGEGLAFGVALAGVGVGLGVGSAGTGEIAERVAGCGAEEDAAKAWATAEDAASEAWVTADVAELAGPDPAAAELTGALPGA